MPTKASTRRTPEPTEDSPVTATRPIWEECCHVGAAAQLAGPAAAHLDDPDLLVVGLAEQRQRADLARVGQRHQVARDVEVGADRLVGGLLDVGSLVLGERRCCQAKSSRR